MQKNTIVSIITTKNRPLLLKRAVASVVSQSYPLDQIIISSDSNNELCINLEKEIATENNIQYLQNKRARNCSGVRNNAVIEFIKDNLLITNNFRHIYFAFLDDDDIWDSTYIEKCYNHISTQPDFIVSGLIFKDEQSERKLRIFDTFSINDFLKGNPHVQGSNIFVKLTTLLKCGLFDENPIEENDRLGSLINISI